MKRPKVLSFLLFPMTHSQYRSRTLATPPNCLGDKELSPAYFTGLNLLSNIVCEKIRLIEGGNFKLHPLAEVGIDILNELVLVGPADLRVYTNLACHLATNSL